MDRFLAPIVDFKASRSEPGVFEAVFAVFGNVDLGGDRLIKGAFSRTLEENPTPPVMYSHLWDLAPIGVTRKATETDEGVRAEAVLYLDADPFVERIYRSLSDGALKEFSFGYRVKDAADVTDDGDTVRELKDVDLLEWGPTLKGMNPATRLVAVKSVLERLSDEDLERFGLARKAEDPPNDDDPPPAADPPATLDPRVAELLLARPH